MSIESTPMGSEPAERKPAVTLNMQPFESVVTASFEEDAQAEVAIEELRRHGATNIVLSPEDHVATGQFRAPSDLVRDRRDQWLAPHGNEPFWFQGEEEHLAAVRKQAAAASGRATVGAEANRNRNIS